MLIKVGGKISAQIYFLIICLHMHTLLRGKKTPNHKPPDHKRSKKDKRNNKKLLTNRKQCYIIQSSTRDKRNKVKKKTQLKK